MEQILYGFQVTIIGMGVVFVILYAISLMLEIMQKVTAEKPKPASKPEAINKEEIKDDTQIIAIITAAIAEIQNNSNSKFKIKTIQRIPQNVPTWGMISRIENLRK